MRYKREKIVFMTLIIYHEGYLHPAYNVAQQIPRYQDMDRVKGFNQPDVKIEIIIGNDMIPYIRSFEEGYQQS